MHNAAQDNREAEAPSLGNIIGDLNRPGDRIPLWCEKRMTTGQGPRPGPGRVGEGSCARLQFPSFPEPSKEGSHEMERPGPRNLSEPRSEGVNAFPEQGHPTGKSWFPGREN